jgi:hypothetical protein
MEIYKDTLYTSGSYYVGLNSFFLKFPLNNQYLQSDFEIRSREGLKVGLTISLAYKLGSANSKKDLLPQLLNIYNNVKYNWQELILRILHQTSRDIVGTYTSNNIVLKRETISNTIFSELSSNLNTRGFSLNNLNLLEIRLDETYMSSLVELEVINQQAQQKAYLLQGLKTQSNTNITLAGIDRETLDYETNYKNLIVKKLSEDKITALDKKVNTLYFNLFNVKDKLRLVESSTKSSASQLLYYYWGKIMQNEGNKNGKLKEDIPENLKEN